MDESSTAVQSTRTRLSFSGPEAPKDRLGLAAIDGVIFNHLYFNSTETPLATMPLGAVKQVEVVYGPMGVINIITENDAAADGSYATARLLAGSRTLTGIDLHLQALVPVTARSTLRSGPTTQSLRAAVVNPDGLRGAVL